MDAEVSAAVAAWVAAVAAVVFGGTGFVLGIMAYMRAGRANEAATESNAIAEDANALAKESNRIAQSSVEVVAAADARAVEQHDVRWDREWYDAGVFRLTNIGRHTAHDVVANLYVIEDRKHRGERSVAESVKVEPGGHIDVEVASLEPLHAAMELAYAGSIGDSGVRLVPFQPEIEERVFWRSPLGVPHDHLHAGQVWFDDGKSYRRRAQSTESAE
ncbi:hypothetical protein [Microbacterium sp. NPDC076895]|uniref:hypothetical protein n=1 Tax=Microbacterium sp. NPDC076895 TaxID=3154957 RepID=UPI0034283A6B